MDKNEWMTATDPRLMLTSVNTLVSDRKIQLLIGACCRHRKSALVEDDRINALIDSAERFTDKIVRESEYSNSHAATQHILGKLISQHLFEEAREVRDLRIALTFGHRGRAIAMRIAGTRIACSLLHDIFGNPFRPVAFSPAWRTTIVVSLAQTIYDDRHLPSGLFDTQRLGVLADALEDAGCDSADILGHLRGSGEHVRGCWAIDLVVGKE